MPLELVNASRRHYTNGSHRQAVTLIFRLVVTS